MCELPTLASSAAVVMIDEPRSYSATMQISLPMPATPSSCGASPRKPLSTLAPRPVTKPSPRIVSPRDRQRRMHTLGALQGVQWPPGDDVRWGPALFPPFPMPWTEPPEENVWAASQHEDRPQHEADAAHMPSAAKIELGLALGAKEFGQFVRTQAYATPAPTDADARLPPPPPPLPPPPTAPMLPPPLGGRASPRAGALPPAPSSARASAHAAPPLASTLDSPVHAPIYSWPPTAAGLEGLPPSPRLVAGHGQSDRAARAALLRAVADATAAELSRLRERSAHAAMALQVSEPLMSP